ncbi:MAG: PrsW family glutamic-type intramembrane protease [Anaerolineae bacterium]
MSVYNRGLLTPPDEEEVYPYRRVWSSLLTENAALIILTIATAVVFGLLGLRLPGALTTAVNLMLIAAPVILWLLFSVVRERFAVEPRQRLITVFVVTALAANALALPIIDGVLQPEHWLPLEGAINRIIGYTFTVGIVQETVKYAVVRFTAWPDLFRTRLDGVAYCAASALGYAFVLNVHFLLAQPGITPDIMAMQMFNNVAVNLAGSLIVAYGLAEVRFDNPMPFLLTITVALAALINGIAIPVRSGLTNAAFVLPATAEAPTIIDTILGAFSAHSVTPKPILAFVFSVVLVLVFGLIVAFLFNNAERQAREAAAGSEV